MAAVTDELNFAQKQAVAAGRAVGGPAGARPSKDEFFLAMADLVSMRSNCRRRHFGAVVVKDGQVISTGYNGTPFGVTNCIDGGCARCYEADMGTVKPGESYDRCLCVHGEANALHQLARHDGGGKGAILYTQASPCIYCIKEIIQAGVVEVVFKQKAFYLDADPALKEVYYGAVRESGLKLRLVESNLKLQLTEG